MAGSSWENVPAGLGPDLAKMGTAAFASFPLKAFRPESTPFPKLTRGEVIICGKINFRLGWGRYRTVKDWGYPTKSRHSKAT